MSNFTYEEAKGFSNDNGGGNESNRNLYYAKLSDREYEKQRPRADDDLATHKRWIKKVYEEKAFYSKSGSKKAKKVGPAAAPLRLPELAPPPFARARPSRRNSATS